MDNKRLFYSEIVILHFLGLIMIFVCHIVQATSQSLLGELLASGVPLFLFISGFLSGVGSKITDMNWIKRKMDRILLPYYILLTTILLLFLTLRYEIVLKTWGILYLNIQGLANYLILGSIRGDAEPPLGDGLGHFWFVTIIMLCYLLWALLNRHFNIKNIIKIFIAAVILHPFLLYIGIQLNSILVFMGGAIYSKLRVGFKTKHLVYISIITAFLGITRIVAKDYLDGTVLYDRYIALLAGDAIGLWIFYFIFHLRNLFPKTIDNLASCKAVVLAESLIYEIYLTHHIFIKGDWSVFKYVENQSLAIIIIILASIISSVILHRAGNLCRSIKMRNLNHRGE